MSDHVNVQPARKDTPVAEFVDDDDGYAAWLEAHPYGYVLNTYRKPAANYLMLHRARCNHLRPRDARHLHTTRDYVKVCSIDIADLQRWADRHFSGRIELSRCGFCKP